jgi:hypothetical protein
MGDAEGTTPGTAPWYPSTMLTGVPEPIERGDKLVVEGAVVDLFERKGHRFVDLDVAALRRADSAAVMATRLRAIYELRPA